MTRTRMESRRASSAMYAAGLNVDHLRSVMKLDIAASNELQARIDQLRQDLKDGSRPSEEKIDHCDLANKNMTRDLLRRIEQIEGHGMLTSSDREMLQAMNAQLAVCDKQTMQITELRDLHRDVQKWAPLPLGGKPKTPETSPDPPLNMTEHLRNSPDKGVRSTSPGPVLERIDSRGRRPVLSQQFSSSGPYGMPTSNGNVPYFPPPPPPPPASMPPVASSPSTIRPSMMNDTNASRRSSQTRVYQTQPSLRQSSEQVFVQQTSPAPAHFPAVAPIPPSRLSSTANSANASPRSSQSRVYQGQTPRGQSSERMSAVPPSPRFNDPRSYRTPPSSYGSERYIPPACSYGSDRHIPTPPSSRPRSDYGDARSSTDSPPPPRGSIDGRNSAEAPPSAPSSRPPGYRPPTVEDPREEQYDDAGFVVGGAMESDRSTWPLLYRILDVDPSTPPRLFEQTMKKALATQGLKHNPVQRPTDPEAPVRWAAICKAYDTLIDPERRRLYDGHSAEPGINDDFAKLTLS